MSGKPSFDNPVFEELYRSDFFINENILREITSLGKEQAVPELLKIVDDTLAHFDEYSEENDWHHNFYFLHALYLLYELDAEETLPVVLGLLKKEHYFLEYWFGDELYEDVPEILARLGKNNLPALQAAINDTSYSLHSRTILGKALAEIVFANSGKRGEVLALFREQLQDFINRAETIEAAYPEDQDPGYGHNIYEYISFLIADLLEINAVELEAEIRECFRKGLVDETIVGDESDITFEEQEHKQPFSSIYQKYENFKGWLGEESPFHPDAENIRRRKQQEAQRQLRKEQANRQADVLSSVLSSPPKVGRNDPCPCGSGKKYKKCCME